MFIEGSRHLAMQVFAPASEQRFVGRIADQRVL
jgi:hypothetical protein